MSGSLMDIYLNTENDRDEDTQKYQSVSLRKKMTTASVSKCMFRSTVDHFQFSIWIWPYSVIYYVSIWRQYSIQF